MDTISIRCNSCGAPLEAGAQARYITCKFCNSQLEIKRTASSVFTEEISKIARTTERMAENLEAIKLQNEIEMLDRESAAAAMSQVAQKGGGGKSGGVLALGFCIFFAIVCFGMASGVGGHGAPGMFTLIPVGMGILGLIIGITVFNQSRKVAEQQNTLQQRRDELARKLEALKNPAEPPMR
jgi:hypothetical protein